MDRMLSDRIDRRSVCVELPGFISDATRFRRTSSRERASNSRSSRTSVVEDSTPLARVSPTYLGARSEKSDVSSQRRFAENANASAKVLYANVTYAERFLSFARSKM